MKTHPPEALAELYLRLHDEDADAATVITAVANILLKRKRLIQAGYSRIKKLPQAEQVVQLTDTLRGNPDNPDYLIDILESAMTHGARATKVGK